MDLPPGLAIPLAVIAGYVLGSVDFAVWVARARGVDIYAVGSGNPGTSNVARTLGKGAAAMVLVGDLLKGTIAAAIGFVLLPEPAGGVLSGWGLAALAGFAAVVGHCFPVLHKFQGGKGVATAVGVLLFLNPVLGLALGALWAVLVAITRTASIGSLVVLLLTPVAYWFVGPLGTVDITPFGSLVWVTAIVVLVLFRHAPNIRRILGREESTITKDG